MLCYALKWSLQAPSFSYNKQYFFLTSIPFGSKQNCQTLPRLKISTSFLIEIEKGYSIVFTKKPARWKHQRQMCSYNKLQCLALKMQIKQCKLALHVLWTSTFVSSEKHFDQEPLGIINSPVLPTRVMVKIQFSKASI